MRRAVLLLLPLGILFCAMSLHAQSKTGVLEGWVQNESGEPLYGITIRIENTDRGTVTDEEGYFEVRNLEATRGRRRLNDSDSSKLKEKKEKKEEAVPA